MAELLVAVMRDGNVGVEWIVLSVALYGLILAGRFKLEWFGTLGQHVFRWLRCKIFNKHLWEAPLYFSTSAPAPRCRTCRICGKVEFRQ